MPLEDGVEIKLGIDSSVLVRQFQVGDFWCFDARTATAFVETLTGAPPSSASAIMIACWPPTNWRAVALSNILSSCRLLWPAADEGRGLLLHGGSALGGDIQKAIVSRPTPAAASV